MVSARRSFEGTLPVAAMSRLCEMLASADGSVRFGLDFGRDELGISYVDVRAEASLSLICQRSLESFLLPVAVSARLGLIRLESEEAGLPPDCEPLLVPENGRLNPADVIEDELMLVLPLIPVNPDSRIPDEVTGPEPEDFSADQGRSENPFAVLRKLKQ
ncbi:MAG: YceD family protein [Rhodanobacter sp.]|jgi:uncharacterized protein|nr:YceD family protein [Rhodanobacter sp.]